MRFALVTLLGALALTAPRGINARADDKADVEKELKKFQGAWTFESSESGGQKLPADQLKDLVLTFDGAKHTVTTTSTTTFHKGGSQASLSDVKQGVRVVAMGDRQSNGDLTATDVRIAPDRPQAPVSPSTPPSPPGGGTQSGNTT